MCVWVTQASSWLPSAFRRGWGAVGQPCGMKWWGKDEPIESQGSCHTSQGPLLSKGALSSQDVRVQTLSIERKAQPSLESRIPGWDVWCHLQGPIQQHPLSVGTAAVRLFKGLVLCPRCLKK